MNFTIKYLIFPKIIPIVYSIIEGRSELRKILEENFSVIAIKESHHILWFGLYSLNIPIIRRPLLKYAINAFSLWFGKNPFLKDDIKRGKRDYYTMINYLAEKI